ncbi:hypothetical protein Tco_0425847 [Tanacetum coccineum]
MAMVRAAFGFFLKLAFKFAGLAYLLFRLDSDADCFIRDRISNGHWEWNWSRNLGGRHSEALNMLLSELANAEVGSGMDAHQWSLSNDGEFSVGSTRNHIDNIMLPSMSFSTRWNKSLPRKFAVCAGSLWIISSFLVQWLQISRVKSAVGPIFLYQILVPTGNGSSGLIIGALLLQENLACSGVLTHPETCYHAKVMFYSLIMFVVILLPSVYGVSYASQEYGIAIRFDTRIQKRRLEYAEVEQKVEMHVPFYDVQALMLDREKHLMIKQKELE